MKSLPTADNLIRQALKARTPADIERLWAEYMRWLRAGGKPLYEVEETLVLLGLPPK